MTKNYKYFLSCASGLAFLLSQSSTAMAATEQNLNISATPEAACKINPITAVVFDNVTTVNYNAPLKVGKIEYQCSSGASMNISADGGNNVDSSTRYLAVKGLPSSPTIKYTLYKDNTGTTEWGINQNYQTTGNLSANGDIQEKNFSLRLDAASLTLIPYEHLNKKFEDDVKFTIAVAV